jgi:hypothetical protein
MSYSKTHQRFSAYLKVPESLERPEDFLGPNYVAVLNFWSWTDTLTARQSNEVALRWQTYYDVGQVCSVNAEDASYAVDPKAAHAAWEATWLDAWGYGGELNVARAITWATQELIGMHILLEQGNQLVFVPMFDKL